MNEIIPINLLPGDEFGTTNPMALARGINGIQWFWSRDKESTYSHSGFITSPKGDTYEALGRIGHSYLTNYIGESIIIARFEALSQTAFKLAFANIKKKHDRQLYPFWRLPLHIFPPAAKFLSFGTRFLVCSELVAKLNYLLGLRHLGIAGTTPDMLADEWRRWQGWKIIGEGILGYEKGSFTINS